MLPLEGPSRSSLFPFQTQCCCMSIAKDLPFDPAVHGTWRSVDGRAATRVCVWIPTSVSGNVAKHLCFWGHTCCTMSEFGFIWHPFGFGAIPMDKQRRFTCKLLKSFRGADLWGYCVFFKQNKYRCIYIIYTVWCGNCFSNSMGNSDFPKSHFSLQITLKLSRRPLR